MRVSFYKVRRIKKEDRPQKWLVTSPMGTIIMLDGDWGTVGGYLRAAPNVWILLDPEQVFSGKEIPWPYSTVIRAITINGDEVEIKQTGQ